MKLIAIFLLFTFANALGNESLNKLIDKFVLQKADVTVEGDTTYLNDDAIDRINGAGKSLIQAGRDAWPVLLRHLNDKRESIACREVSGPHDVGHQCYWLLSAQLVDLPEGYIKSKTRDGKGGENHMTPGLYYEFSPDLKNWLLKRRDWTLDQMKLEVIKDVLKENDEIGYANDEDRNRIRSLLLQHIKLLERNDAKENAEQAGTGQPATRPELKSEGSQKPQSKSEERSR